MWISLSFHAYPISSHNIYNSYEIAFLELLRRWLQMKSQSRKALLLVGTHQSIFIPLHCKDVNHFLITSFHSPANGTFFLHIPSAMEFLIPFTRIYFLWLNSLLLWLNTLFLLLNNSSRTTCRSLTPVKLPKKYTSLSLSHVLTCLVFVARLYLMDVSRPGVSTRWF